MATIKIPATINKATLALTAEAHGKVNGSPVEVASVRHERGTLRFETFAGAPKLPKPHLTRDERKSHGEVEFVGDLHFESLAEPAEGPYTDFSKLLTPPKHQATRTVKETAPPPAAAKQEV